MANEMVYSWMTIGTEAKASARIEAIKSKADLSIRPTLDSSDENPRFFCRAVLSADPVSDKPGAIPVRKVTASTIIFEGDWTSAQKAAEKEAAKLIKKAQKPVRRAAR